MDSCEICSNSGILLRFVAAATRIPLTGNAQIARRLGMSAFSSRCPRLPRRLSSRFLQYLVVFLQELRSTERLGSHLRQLLVLEALVNHPTDLVRETMDFRYHHLRARIIHRLMIEARLGDDDVQKMTTGRVFRLRTCIPTKTLVEGLQHLRKAARRLITNTPEAENMIPEGLPRLNGTALGAMLPQLAAREQTP